MDEDGQAYLYWGNPHLYTKTEEYLTGSGTSDGMLYNDIVNVKKMRRNGV